MRALTYDELKREYNKAYPPHFLSAGQRLSIEGVWPGYASHNPTPPVWISVNGIKQLVMGVRLESSREQMESVSLLFEPSQPNEDLLWHPMTGTRIFPSEDLFITTIHGEIIVLCKQALPVSKPWITAIPCCTVMYRGTDVNTLRRCAVWDYVNCVRPIELPSGNIGVYTREKKGAFGHAVIMWRVVETIGDITQEGLDSVTPIPLDVFAPNEWGAVNEPHLCSDGITIGAVGHVAKQVTPRRVEYASMAFEFNPTTGRWSQPRIIAMRRSFPDGRAKRPSLAEVIYPGGVRFIDGEAFLYAGTGDALAQRVRVARTLVDFY